MTGIVGIHVEANRWRTVRRELIAGVVSEVKAKEQGVVADR